MSKPIVAIVGRPNVGKSTLFNVLAGDNISIVKDTPGVTRDRIYADVEWLNHKFTLVDTGGIEPESKDIILSQMRDQAQIAIDTANVIIFITDVRQGLVDADAKVADMLRRSRKPVVLVVNKVDNFDRQMMDVYEFYNLGIGEPHAISASGKLGIGDMLDEVTGYFDPEMENEEESEIPRIAIDGYEVDKSIKADPIQNGRQGGGGRGQGGGGRGQQPRRAEGGAPKSSGKPPRRNNDSKPAGENPWRSGEGKPAGEGQRRRRPRKPANPQ